MLMFGDITMGISRASSPICAFASAENPVEPTTSGTFFAAQLFACAIEASGVVKSMTTFAPPSAASSESETGTSSMPR